MRKALLGVIGVVALLLNGCSSNHNGEVDICDTVLASVFHANCGAPLATDEDATREVGNIFSVFLLTELGAELGGELTGNFGQPVESATASSGRARAVAALRNALRQRGFASPAFVRPEQTLGGCVTSGTRTVTGSGSKTRQFEFFEVDPTVNFEAVAYNACTDTSTSSSTTNTDVVNGAAEGGEQPATDDSGNQYVYAVMGAGSSPLAVTETDANTSTSTTQSLGFSLLGGVEVQEHSSSPSTEDFRSDFSGTLSASQQSSSGTVGGSADYALGSAQTPFDLLFGEQSSGDGTVTTLSFNGPYSFSNPDVAGCNGGVLTYTTTTPLVEGSPLFSAGVVTVSSAGASITVTFNSDGGATISFSNGIPDLTLTAAQVQSAITSSACAPVGQFFG